MIQSFRKIDQINGTLKLQGDKSISHRALLISSMAKGKSIIKNISESDDVKSTINCLNALGIDTDFKEGVCSVFGKGLRGYKKPSLQLFAGNSGTTARLLSGILAAQNFESVIEGDKSLSNRPMKRVIEPLVQMGAEIRGNDEGRLPLKIFPSEKLKAIDYTMPIASAQVKSAILFAGLHLKGQTSVIETVSTRNHTENLLGLNIIKKDSKIISNVSSINYPEPKEYFIPGDISSAMYIIVLALLIKDSELIVKDVSLNPTRIEFINILKTMGGNIQIEEKGKLNNEIFGDVIVKSSDLRNVKISKETVPLIIDEIPILTIAGIFAEGIFELRGASELRLKESDRIKSVCKNLLLTGLSVEEYDDGFRVDGQIRNVTQSFESFNDHRIAMAFAVLASLLKDGGEVNGFECISVSNPEFLKQIHSVSI